MTAGCGDFWTVGRFLTWLSFPCIVQRAAGALALWYAMEYDAIVSGVVTQSQRAVRETQDVGTDDSDLMSFPFELTVAHVTAIGRAHPERDTIGRHRPDYSGDA